MTKIPVNKVFIVLLAVFVFFMFWAQISLAKSGELQFATSIGELLKPETWFEVLKKNITIPVLDEEVTLPTPAQTLEGASSTLRDINKDIKEEVGIDFAKFFGWFAKVLKAFFQVIIGLIETISQTLSG